MMALEHLPGGLTAGLVRLGELTNRSLVLPLVVFYPTARCNSRCRSCDWWRASGDDDLSVDEIRTLVAALPGLGARVVLFSGGEPLLRRDVFAIADLFRAAGLRLHLLTSGVLLERFAPEVVRMFERVVLSLDATTESLYKSVRGVPALACVERGVARLRELAPALPVTARSTLHRYNFRELPALIDHARAMGLDGISFLAADLASTAFGRQQPTPIRDLALSAAEVEEFAGLVEQVIVGHADDFASGFVAESPGRLRRLPAVLCRARRAGAVSPSQLQCALDVGGGRGQRHRAPVLLPRPDWQCPRAAAGPYRGRQPDSVPANPRRLDQRRVPPVRLLDQDRMAGWAMAVAHRAEPDPITPAVPSTRWHVSTTPRIGATRSSSACAPVRSRPSPCTPPPARTCSTSAADLAPTSARWSRPAIA